MAEMGTIEIETVHSTCTSTNFKKRSVLLTYFIFVDVFCFYFNEGRQLNFPSRLNKAVLYCIVFILLLHCIVSYRSCIVLSGVFSGYSGLLLPPSGTLKIKIDSKCM